MTSRTTTTSPDRSLPRAKMTLKLSLSATSCPITTPSATSGCTVTRSFRPELNTSTVLSSLRPTTVP